jgi:hypothetical protein
VVGPGLGPSEVTGGWIAVVLVLVLGPFRVLCLGLFASRVLRPILPGTSDLDQLEKILAARVRGRQGFNQHPRKLKPSYEQCVFYGFFD